MRGHFVNIGVVAVGLLASIACGQDSVIVEYGSGDTFSQAERRTIETVADKALRDVRHVLPGLPIEVRLTVQTGTRVIPETGETAEVGLPSSVYWTVNPKHPGGVVGIVNAQLRGTLVHELYHLVREAQVAPRSLADQAVDEGLATAFERDFGGAPAPWGAYPSDVADWTKEFLALPDDAPRGQWMFKHSDGRRWIGFKVGTYLADQAARRSGLSLARLATLPTAKVIELARLAG